MSDLKSTWVEFSYEILDPDKVWRRYYWQSATMEKDPIECLLRNWGMSKGQKGQLQDLKQYDENHYSCIQSPNRYDKETFIELHFDCQNNPFPKRDNQTIYDHRERDLEWEKKRLLAYTQEIPRPGLKKMPMQMNFGKK